MEKLCHYAAQFTRKNVSQLVLGLKPAASDGFSGITANPLLGWVADKADPANTGHGNGYLTEVPEMFRCPETLLMNRCRDRATLPRR